MEVKGWVEKKLTCITIGKGEVPTLGRYWTSNDPIVSGVDCAVFELSSCQSTKLLQCLRVSGDINGYKPFI